jgi:thioredoxin reductase
VHRRSGRLQGVRISRASRPGASELAIHGLFVFIGAQRRTGWLAGQLAEDSRGFLLTGTGIPAAALGDQAEQLGRVHPVAVGHRAAAGPRLPVLTRRLPYLAKTQ